MIRVLLVTQMRLIGNLAAAILRGEPDMEVTGIVTSAAETMECVAECDVVLVSPGLPGSAALDLTSLISEKHPEVKVIITTPRCASSTLSPMAPLPKARRWP